MTYSCKIYISMASEERRKTIRDIRMGDVKAFLGSLPAALAEGKVLFSKNRNPVVPNAAEGEESVTKSVFEVLDGSQPDAHGAYRRHTRVLAVRSRGVREQGAHHIDGETMEKLKATIERDTDFKPEPMSFEQRRRILLSGQAVDRKKLDIQINADMRYLKHVTSLFDGLAEDSPLRPKPVLDASVVWERGEEQPVQDSDVKWE